MTRRFLLDTNALGDLIFRRRGVHERAAEERKKGAKIGTCPPVIGELYSGAEGSASRERNLAAVVAGLRGITVWPYHTAEAMIFGQLHAHLKRVGRPMQVVDIQLAAVARLLGHCTVVTSDTDLSAIPDLSVENWIVPPPSAH